MDSEAYAELLGKIGALSAIARAALLLSLDPASPSHRRRVMEQMRTSFRYDVTGGDPSVGERVRTAANIEFEKELAAVETMIREGLQGGLDG